MSQEIQHLYELLGPEQFREVVLPGLDRLLSALDEKMLLLTNSVDSYDPNQYICEMSDGTTFLLGIDSQKTIEMKIEAENQLNEVCAILGALTLPSSYNDLDKHVREAFDQVEHSISGFQLRRHRRLAALEDKAAASRTPPRTAADNLRTGTAWASPFLKFMNKLNAELGPHIHQMTKDDLISRIESDWDEDVLGERSGKKIDAMGTLLRTPEAGKGRAKPKL